jgi:hypothetical protein
VRRSVCGVVVAFLFLCLAPPAVAGRGPTPPPKCLVVDTHGNLPSCVYSHGKWTISYNDTPVTDTSPHGSSHDDGGGGTPTGLIALFVIVGVLGISVTTWRVSVARSKTRSVGRHRMTNNVE